MAATVIDALLVSLGLDASAFEKAAEKTTVTQKKIEKQAIETGEAVEKQEKKTESAQVERGKQLEIRGKQVALSVSKLRNEALALFAVFTGGVGIKNFLTNTLNAQAGLERMSSNLGMTATELSMWQLANERAGGSTAGMTEQIKEANGELAKFQNGMGSEKIMELFSWAARAGVSLNIDDLKTGTDVLMARSKVLEALSKIDPAKAQIANYAMGGTDDTFNLLKQGPVLVEQQRLAQRKLAEEMARNAPAAEAFRKQLNDLSHSFEAMAIQVLPKLMPYMERLANWFIRTIPTIEAFAAKVDGAVESLGGWTNVLIALGALKLVSMAGGLTAVGVALSGIATTLGFIGGAVGVAALATLTGIGLLTASSGLNKGEDDELAKRRKMAPTIDGPAGSAPAMFDALEKKHGLPSGLLDSVWAQESGRGKNMTSPAGAKGHFQFMDPTAKQYGLKDPNNLEESAGAAARMYADLLKQSGGDLPRALAGYNWGQGNVQRQGMENAPAETRGYISGVMGRMGAKNAAAAASMPSGAAASAKSGNGGNTNSTSTTDVRVGTVNVQTQATDAPGIAKSIGGALEQYSFAMQANTGLA